MRRHPALVDFARATVRVAAALAVATPAQAAEFDLEGYYRARVRAYDSLSIDRTLADSEGARLGASHRLWLRPKILVNDKVTVQFDLRGLDGAAFGTDPLTYEDPQTGELPTVFTDAVNAPAIGLGAPGYDLSLWRAWATVDTEVGKFSFGRMPLRWGLGLWLNDGLSWNGDYGDTQDRVQWEGVFRDVFVMAAVGTAAEGDPGVEDDITTFDVSAGYKSETVTAGVYAQYKRAPADDVNLVTADIAAHAKLGALELGVEGVGRLGGGDIVSDNDSVLAGAAAIDARLDANPWKISLLGGFASGDAVAGDGQVHGFAIDRDFNTGFLLFEQTMPLTGTTGAGTAVADLSTAPWVENAIFGRPGVGYKLPHDLEADLSVLIARVGVLPSGAAAGRAGLGQEIDLSMRYRGVEQFDVVGTFGVFLPGGYYRNFSNDEYPDGFSGTVLGGQLVMQARF